MMIQETTCEILLAEDSAADVALVKEALREHGVDCALHIARDGAEAIVFIKALDADPRAPHLDLVLLDMHLPKRDGEEILRILRSTERYSQTPVIVMTASASPRTRAAAEKHAVLHYFPKPSDLGQFLQLGGIVKGILDAGRGECGHPGEIQ